MSVSARRKRSSVSAEAARLTSRDSAPMASPISSTSSKRHVCTLAMRLPPRRVRTSRSTSVSCAGAALGPRRGAGGARVSRGPHLEGKVAGLCVRHPLHALAQLRHRLRRGPPPQARPLDCKMRGFRRRPGRAAPGAQRRRTARTAGAAAAPGRCPARQRAPGALHRRPVRLRRAFPRPGAGSRGARLLPAAARCPAGASCGLRQVSPRRRPSTGGQHYSLGRGP